ncbi:hypothetical protein OVA26_17160 [Microbacterium sp. SL62]|uniref:hypothetical protein n=1 Tax=Microbacterium sp. SL62 TaxID=2995139 RepID=UPI0022759DB4|nr:hypothetical protein [Microbacterium sp. SL62]MCY1718668.1 hypothetical protein [Microbacterium sp. SL62]
MSAPVMAGVKVAAGSKTGRRLLTVILGTPVLMAVGAGIVVVMLVNVVFGGGAAASFGAGCVPQLGLVEKVQQDLPRFTVEQLTNAAAIMQAAAEAGLPRSAQVLGVQAALQESGLRVLGYGDAIGPDSRGLFQQRDNWGSSAVRMDPAASAGLFFGALKQVPGWEALPPEQAIHAVQRNERASDYVPRRADAESIVAAWSNASCTALVRATAQEAAAQVVALHAAGKVTYLEDKMWEQVVDTANGVPAPNCQVDVRVLQLIVLAGQWYSEVRFSDLGRLCVNDCSYGAGMFSMHCKSPDLAVDFISLDGTPSSGADDRSIDFIRRLIPVLPQGAGIGQSNCRSSAGDSLKTPGLRQFPDSCNHLHIELPLSEAPLTISQPGQ